MMVSSVICQNEEVLAALKDGSCDIGILPFPLKNSFKEINGFNFLLRTELGFWDTLCREKMPASKFLVQTDSEAHVTFYITNVPQNKVQKAADLHASSFYALLYRFLF